MKVLEQFDKSISETLAHNVKSKGNVKGHLHNYRLCDEVYYEFYRQSRYVAAIGSHIASGSSSQMRLTS